MYPIGLFIFWSVMLAAMLGGCTTTGNGRAVQSLKPVCDALIGPIKYNSANPKSPRYAGSALAPDLQQRNDVGANLRCPAYSR